MGYGQEYERDEGDVFPAHRVGGEDFRLSVVHDVCVGGDRHGKQREERDEGLASQLEALVLHLSAGENHVEEHAQSQQQEQRA